MTNLKPVRIKALTNLREECAQSSVTLPSSDLPENCVYEMNK